MLYLTALWAARPLLARVRQTKAGQ